MNSRTWAILVAAATAVVSIAGCKDHLPTDPGTAETGTIYYTAWDSEASPDRILPTIYSISADGSNRKRVAPGVLFAPPANGLLVYATQGPDFFSNIQRCNQDGTNMRDLAPGVEAFYPALSADGRLIAFTVADSLLYVIDPDGSNLRLLANNAIHETHMAVSPNGKWVAYYGKGTQSGMDHLCIAAVDGSGWQTVCTNADNQNDFGGGIGWSIDAGTIFFLGRSASGNRDVFRVGIDGQGLVNLTNDSQREYSPAVSPDGSRVAYSVYERAGAVMVGSDIWMVNADGSNKRNVSNTGGLANAERYPTWSPDGNSLLYVRYVLPGSDSETGLLYAHNLTTSHVTLVADKAFLGYWAR